jgi:hypothetical protein
MDILTKIRNQITSEEFDYQLLVSCLSEYANPRSKIRDLSRKGIIIRVKKGIYIFGDQYRRSYYSREILANWIYGPSLVSMETMLSYYGLIPERVDALTSTTTKRPKEFNTPVGLFTYQQVPLAWYTIGINRIENPGGMYLAASPERALADKVLHDLHNHLQSLKDASAYLFEDLRLDEDGFRQMDPDILFELARVGKSRKTEFCARLLKKMK